MLKLCPTLAKNGAQQGCLVTFVLSRFSTTTICLAATTHQWSSQHSVVASGCVVHFGFQLPMSLRCHPRTPGPGDISSGVYVPNRSSTAWYTALLRCCLFGGTTLKVSSILSEEHFLHLVEMARIASVVTQEYNKTFQVSSHSSVKLGVDVKAEKVASR